MIGRVRLKSKRAAFSISSARDGGAKEREVAARREKDLRAEEGERERMCWSLGSLGILGREIWEIWGVGLGKGREEVGEMRGFEEAMIMLAMVECGGWLQKKKKKKKKMGLMVVLLVWFVYRGCVEGGGDIAKCYLVIRHTKLVRL